MTPRCGLCGRLLRDPASRARGLGPVCARRSQSRSARRPSLQPAALPIRAIHGQAQLPPAPEQCGLWPDPSNLPTLEAPDAP